MDVAEIQAKVTIAAALIVSHAVELPSLPKGHPVPDPAMGRLRDLTNYIYEALAEGKL